MASDTATLVRGDRNVVGSVENSIIVTGNNVQVAVQLDSPAGALLVQQIKTAITPNPKPTPVDERQPPFPGHVGRRDEAAALMDLVNSSPVVNLLGDANVGKSYLLNFALNQAPPTIMPDGVLYLPVKGEPLQDLIQALFNGFYETPAVVQDPKLRHFLKDKRALIVLDSVELPPDETQKLMYYAPSSKFVLVTRDRSEGVLLRLGGLKPEDALAFLESELGRPITPEKKQAARTLCNRLEGHPLRIRRSAQSLTQGASIEELLSNLGDADSARLPAPPLTAEEVKVLRVLAGLGSAVVGVEHLKSLAGIPALQSVLDALEGRHLVESHSPRYNITASVPEDMISTWDLNAERERALRYFLSWAEGNSRNYETLLRESSALLALFDWTRRSGRHVDSIRLGRSIEAGLAKSRRWGTWALILEGVLESARALGDRTTEAWALHQLGTRAYCLGEAESGIRLLKEALKIRKSIKDVKGIEATRQNLGIIRPSKLLGFLRGLPKVPLVVIAILIGIGISAPRMLQLVDRLTPFQTNASFSVELGGRGDGIVTSDPEGISCPDRCTAEFEEGTELTLTATAVTGSVFSRWSGSCTGTDACKVRIGEQESTTAVFDLSSVPTPLLKVRLLGSGSGTVVSSPSGVSCSQECEAPFPAGSAISLAASPEEGSIFEGWSGGCSGTGFCQPVLNSDTVVEALFSRSEGVANSLTVDLAGKGTGRVTSYPSGILCPGLCEAPFLDGTQLTLTAEADPESVFAGWKGACTGESVVCLVTADQKRRVTAEFGDIPNAPATTPAAKPGPTHPTLTVNIENPNEAPGAVKVVDSLCFATCQEQVSAGISQTLEAIPNEGYVFAGWSGACSNELGDCAVTMTGDRTVTASFVPAPNNQFNIWAMDAGTKATVTVVGRGTVMGPDDQKCSGDGEKEQVCKFAIPAGEVGFQAFPEPGYFFSHWDGDCPNSEPEPSNVCSVMGYKDEPVQVSAVFYSDLI